VRGWPYASISARRAGISIATAAAWSERDSRHAMVGGAQAAELLGEAREGSWTASAAGMGSPRFHGPATQCRRQEDT